MSSSSKKSNVIASVTPTDMTPYISKTDKKASREKLERFAQEESRMVKGIFKNFETPGGSTRIQVKKYPVDLCQPFDMTMMDGEMYEIPLYVARHLNGIDATATAINGKIHSCSYPVHGFRTASMSADDLARSQYGNGPQGQSGIPVPIVGVQRYKQRFGFQSMEFESSVV